MPSILPITNDPRFQAAITHIEADPTLDIKAMHKTQAGNMKLTVFYTAPRPVAGRPLSMAHLIKQALRGIARGTAFSSVQGITLVRTTVPNASTASIYAAMQSLKTEGVLRNPSYGNWVRV